MEQLKGCIEGIKICEALLTHKGFSIQNVFSSSTLNGQVYGKVKKYANKTQYMLYNPE